METFSEKKSQIALFQEISVKIKDNRRMSKGNFKHPMLEILFLTLSASISGCNTWQLVESFGKLKIDWLRKFFPYEHGTASDNVFGIFFGCLDTKAFSKCFMEFMQTLAKLESKVVAIDGKTIRGVASTHRNHPLHIVSAYCENNRLCLAQEAVEDKSNEITVIPKLLEMIELEGAIVTIDAIGCQTDIALKIRERKADYILQVKDNQKGLHGQIKKMFEISQVKEESIAHDLGHGRMEIRKTKVIDDLTLLDDKEDWHDFKTIIEIDSKVISKNTGKESSSKRHYISSLRLSAKEIGKAIRGHWSIENNLHWNLDVIYKEDFALKRKGNSAENFNLISKISLGLIDAEKSTKKSKPIKRFEATVDDNYRELIMGL